MEATVSLAVGSGLLHQAESRRMGGGLKGVSNNAYVVLLIMCKTARDIPTDKEPADCYFRGWEHLALQLGYEELDPAGKKAVMRAIAELTRAGVVERDHFPGRDRRKAAYRIRL